MVSLETLATCKFTAEAMDNFASYGGSGDQVLSDWETQNGDAARNSLNKLDLQVGVIVDRF